MLSEEPTAKRTPAKVIVRENKQRPWLLCLLVLCILYIGVQQRRIEGMTQFELHKIKEASYHPTNGIVMAKSTFRRNREQCDFQTIVYFDPSIPELDGFLDIHANLAFLRRARLNELQDTRVTFIMPRDVDFVFPRQSKVEVEMLDYMNKNEQLVRLHRKCHSTLVQVHLNVVHLMWL